MSKNDHVLLKSVVTCLPPSSGRVSDAPRRARKTLLLIHTRNHEWPRNVALSVPIPSLSLPFSKIHLIRRAKLCRPVHIVVLKIVPTRTRIRGKLSSHSILTSLLKDLQPPVIGLLIYNPKHVRNPQYCLSLDPNHVHKLLCSSLLYPNRLLNLLDHLLNHLRLLHLLLLYSPRASCRPINGS